MPEGYRLDEQAQEFLRAMLDETSLSIESIRMRRREIATLRELRAVQRKTDLTSQLQVSWLMFRNIKSRFCADTASERESGSEPLQLSAGKYPDQARGLVNSVVQGVLASAKPLLLGDIEREDPTREDIRSLVVAPLVVQDGQAVGALLSANLRTQNFNQRHLSLLHTLASQVTLVVQHSQLMAEIEYKTLMAERTRLAREIHDGLAQTLGFLKLQNAQMQNYQNQKNDEKLKESLAQSYKVLSEAYLDARQAIDGLRISPDGNGLLKWLEQTLVEFEENSGIPATLDEYQDISGLAPEVQAQIIRIVQEALSNVRKHANAHNVWVSISQKDQNLVLEVRDDGCGFEPEDIPSTSRYGLQGMRERTELIGADFQVISRQDEGTIVRIRLPLASGVTIQ
jgi:two-component system nitrate/nitrite sensor histidine kinase NarX